MDRLLKIENNFVGWVEPRNPTHLTIDCVDVGFHIRSTQPTGRFRIFL